MTAAVAYHPIILPARVLASMNSLNPRTIDSRPSKAKLPHSGKDYKVVRGRRERPCDACRKRKSKCVTTEGARNVCAACGIHGQECTYIEDPQPRKRRLEGEGKDADLAKRRSVVSESQSEGTGDRTPVIKREHEPFKVVSDRGLSNSPAEISWLNPPHYATHIGYTTELEPILFDISQATGTLTLENRYQKPDQRNAFLLHTTDHDYTGDTYSGALGKVEGIVGSIGPSLMSTYQTTTNRYFPILDEAFFQIYERQRNRLDPTLLCAVYLLAASTGTGFSSSRIDIGQLEEIAFRLFESSLDKPLLSTIQAGILLIQSPNVDSNILNTQLVGIAYELGLHLNCSSWKLSNDARSLRKRLAWALYMQDKWCSLIYGRPSLITKAHWAVQDLAQDEYFLDSDESQEDVTTDDVKRGQELFHQMVTLTEILSTVLDTFYTLQAMQEVDNAGSNGTRLILERAKPVQIRLKEWFTHLPGNLKMDNNMSGNLSSTGHLHLAYFATEITLHRCIIRSLSTPDSDPDTYLSHICRSAAKTRLISAMDFVNRLRPDHLSSFWYFPSKVNFALIATFGSLLLATAPGHEEADFYRTRLGEYRWTLCVSSKSTEFLSFAVDSLDTSSLLLRSLPQKPSTSELYARLPHRLSGSSATPQPVATTGRLSPPQEPQPASLHLYSLGGLDHGGDSRGLVDEALSPSGLASPSTSTSSSSNCEAYAEAFEKGGMGGYGPG